MEETYKEKKIWKSIVIIGLILLFLLLAWAVYNTAEVGEESSIAEQKKEKNELSICFEGEFSYSCATKLEVESEKICTTMAPNTANKCYAYFAVREKDLVICEAIQNIKEKEDCIENTQIIILQEFVNEGETFE